MRIYTQTIKNKIYYHAFLSTLAADQTASCYTYPVNPVGTNNKHLRKPWQFSLAQTFLHVIFSRDSLFSQRLLNIMMSPQFLLFVSMIRLQKENIFLKTQLLITIKLLSQILHNCRYNRSSHKFCIHFTAFTEQTHKYFHRFLREPW